MVKKVPQPVKEPQKGLGDVLKKMNYYVSDVKASFGKYQ